MKRRLNKIAPFVVLSLLLCATGRAQSLAYSNAIATLNPAGYWPMHESEAAAPGDIETNYGTLGVLGNAYYPDYQVNSGEFIRQQYGPLGNGTDESIFFNALNPSGGTATNGTYVPRTSPLATLKPPFSVECWYMATNIGTGQGDLWSEADGTKTSGIRVYYQNSPPNDQLSCLTYDGSSSGQVNFPAPTVASNVWHHIVVTCTAATNITTWLDGVQKNSTSEVGKYNADAHTPFAVGTGLGFARAFRGLLSEVAVYTNVITDISTHYNDGTNALAGPETYLNDVENDNPVIWLRMNSQNYSAPSAGSWPTLQNYGETNGTAINNGVYTPGTMPAAVSGNVYGGYPLGLISSNVTVLSGVSSFADAGYAAAYNPTGGVPFTVTALFRGNPADTNRVQTIVGHGTNSWTLGLTPAGSVVFNPGTNSTAATGTGTGPGDLVYPKNYHDGNWHWAAAVYGGTNNLLCIDGSVIATNPATTNFLGNSDDVIIGSDPSYTNTPAGLGRQFAGQISDVAFFTNALTLAQLQALYNEIGIRPQISQQPISATVNAGIAFTNTVAATGSTPLSYQWFTNGVPIGGATNASLILNPVAAIDDSTNYYAIVTNEFGMATSAVVSLTVYTIPVLTSELPLPYTNLFTLYPGVSPTFSVTAAGPQPVYAWYTNGVLDDADAANSLTLTNVEAAFTNYCIVANSYGSVTSIVWSAQIAPNPIGSSGLAPYPQAVLSLKPVGYWRMNDTNLDGVDYPSGGSGDFGWICHDYAGGNDGMYTNCQLGFPGYNPTLDPSDSSAQFGEIDDLGSDFGDSLAFGIKGINFSSPSNTSVAFTVTAWVSGYPQTSDAGIVTLGWGGGGEQFNLDTGSDPGHNFRFFVRDAGGNVHGVSSTNPPTTTGQGPWYQLVGVVDEITSQTVTLYINGQNVGSAALASGSGILASTYPMGIGARMGSQTSNFNDQFLGNINDVAIFNYALSSNELLQLFNASGLGPTFSQEPLSTSADYDGTLVIPAVADGSPPLSYRWFDVGANSYIPGQTNATLVVSNDIASDSYYLTVSNPYGSTNSDTVLATVVSGRPQINAGPQNPFYAIAGETATNSVTVYGSIPLAYQWQYSNSVGWVSLSGSRFSAQSSTLAISDTYPSDAGFYQLVVTNVSGAVTSSPAELIVAGVPLGFDNGLFWTGNGAASFGNGLLTLTTAPPDSGGTASYFFQVPQYIGAFEAFFTYQAQYAGTIPLADGTTFCLQDDPRKAAAIGLGGGDLAVMGNTGNPLASGQTITPSVELELNIFPGNGVGGMGYCVETNGVIGQTTVPGSVSLTNGPVDVSIYYDNGQMALSFSNEVTAATYSTSVNVGDITKILGTNTAVVGFTGSYGGDYSTQTITNFTFLSLPTQTIHQSGTNAVISWPSSIAGYALQETSDLNSGDWVDVTNAITVINGQNQVTIPSGTTNMFFRLTLLQ